MVVNTKIRIKNQKLYGKIKLIGNKSVFKILEITQNEALTINEVVKKVQIAKAKVKSHLSHLNKLRIIDKSKDGKFVRIKSKVNLNKLSKAL